MPATTRRRPTSTTRNRASTPRPEFDVARLNRVVYLTADGRQALHQRIDRLRREVVAPLGAMIGDPSHDRRIDDDYDRAYSEAARLEQLLAEASDIRPPEDRELVGLGSLVDIRFDDGTMERLRLVHAAEAFLDDERVSVGSPVARALLGKRRGQTVAVQVPAGRVKIEIVAVWQPEAAVV